MELTLEGAAAAMGGTLSDPSVRLARPTGVSIDSRGVRAGELFFAIPGERFDGHDFVSDAFRMGAVCSVVQDDRRVDRGLGPLIAVKDTIGALQKLSAHYRSKLSCTVVAVTGSNGKTTTKDLVAHVLAGAHQVGGTQGNLNNHLGVPLTLLSLRPEHEAAVIEMGASRRGEISILARLARPRIGIITNVGPTHLEEMGSVENVARTKAELASELISGGTLAVNGDDDMLLSAVKSLSRKDINVITCGFGRSCRVRAMGCRSLGLKGIEFEVEGYGAATIPTLGSHNVYNALLAIAVGREMGMAFPEMRARMATFRPPSMRLEVLRVGGLVVLNDSYNSNPASAEAALKALREYPGRGRRVAVLGDMLELGSHSERLHKELGKKASFVDWLLAIGHWAQDMVGAAVDAGLDPGRASVYPDKGALAAALRGGLKRGDVVLIKASRALGMEEIAQALEGGLPKGT